ncbi:Alpha-catulin, partial [Chelonia mydas]
ITTLINHKDKPKRSDKTLQAIQRVGQAVNLAVGRFVTVGEAIANENRELKEEMSIACIEAKRADEEMKPPLPASLDEFKVFQDFMNQMAETLDMPLEVLATMEQLEKVSSFQEFVQIFSQFGNEMVEFAHLTGDRQNDLKDEKKKARMAAARAVLEKCTMMLLTASKTCLRHPDCESALLNKEGVFHRMRLALEQVIEIVTDSRPSGENEMAPISIYTSIKEFKNKVEGLRENLYFLSKENLSTMLELILEHTEDFTDSAYTSHEHRERILEQSKQAKMELEQLVSVWMQAQSQKTKDITEDLEVAILKTCQCMNELKRELHHAATSLAADLLRYHADHMVLKALKITGVEGNLEAVAEYTCKLSEQKEQLVEVALSALHFSTVSHLSIAADFGVDATASTGNDKGILDAASTVSAITIISAAETLTLHPSSKIAKENLDVFCEAWESQLSDMSMLLREINDVFEGRRDVSQAPAPMELSSPLSDPPNTLGTGRGTWHLAVPSMLEAFQATKDILCLSVLPTSASKKHNANLKALKPVKLDTEEQAKLGKLGLELHLLTSDVDSETEKWEDQENEIVHHGQSISSMAHSMYLFTRGEGLLKTTQDLFHQAEVFATEGIKLASVLTAFSNQLEDDDTPLLLLEIDKLIPVCQQLQITAKTTVQGKNATFTKVDTCIRKTKGVMTILSQVLPLSCKLLKKCGTGNGWLKSPHPWRENRLQTNTNDDSMEGKTDAFGIKSLEHHVANLTFLESK